MPLFTNPWIIGIIIFSIIKEIIEYCPFFSVLKDYHLSSEAEFRQNIYNACKTLEHSNKSTQDVFLCNTTIIEAVAIYNKKKGKII